MGYGVFCNILFGRKLYSNIIGISEAIKTDDDDDDEDDDDVLFFYFLLFCFLLFLQLSPGIHFWSGSENF